MKAKTFGIMMLFLLVMIGIIMNTASNLYSENKEKTSPAKTNERISIAHPEFFGELERPPVVFDHNIHADKYKKDGCKTCHVQDEKGKFIFDPHFQKQASDKNTLMDTYHDTCIGCHTKLISERQKAGPVKCGSCHSKKIEPIPHLMCEFDFAHHEKHIEKLEKDCSHCHHIYDLDEEDETKRLVYKEGKEESCFYCHDLQKERGPSLSKIVQVSAKKGLTMRRVSHLQCVNCHLEFMTKKEEAGPVTCSECHSGKYRTVEELAKIPRPDRDQPERPFIFIKDAQMKGVPFDHSAHEKGSRNCRACHHETLQACKKCHGLTGSPEGKEINIAGAYHDIFSATGCIGCHASRKSENDCSGCHHHLLDMDILAKGPKKQFCAICHNGRKEESFTPTHILIQELSARDVPEKVTIKVLEKEYKPAIFPHRDIVKKLIEISNKSDMASYFHRNIETICRGCHHESDPSAAVKKNTPPYCRSCHSLHFDSQNLNKPRLIAAYHRQCIGCHDKMGITKTNECKDCHEEKKHDEKDLEADLKNKGVNSER